MQVDKAKLDEIERLFPNLRNLHGITYRVTSNRTRKYNCIAWAIDETKTDKGLWPNNPFYAWDADLPQENTIAAFVALAKKHGYEPCESEEFEPDFEKVALYAKGNAPQHMARQLPTGSWTSKLGGLEDIRHNTLHGVEGTEYGKVVQVFKRRRVVK